MLVVLEGLHREQGKVHPARDVALKDGVAHVLAPHWQALASTSSRSLPLTTVDRDRPGANRFYLLRTIIRASRVPIPVGTVELAIFSA